MEVEATTQDGPPSGGFAVDEGAEGLVAADHGVEDDAHRPDVSRKGSITILQNVSIRKHS